MYFPVIVKQVHISFTVQCVLCGRVYLLFCDANCDVMFTYILRKAVGTGVGEDSPPPSGPPQFWHEYKLNLHQNTLDC